MLEKVVPKTSDRLQEAVKNFIRTKRAFNDYEPKAAGYLDWVSSLNPHAFIDQYESGYACSPALTLRNVLPFFESHPTGDVTRRPASVPVALVMGSSWRWAEHLIPNSTRSAEEWETYLTADRRVQHDTASVTFVRQLGLFFDFHPFLSHFIFFVVIGRSEEGDLASKDDVEFASWFVYFEDYTSLRNEPSY